MIQSEKLNELTKLKHQLIVKESMGTISQIEYDKQMRYVEDNMRRLMDGMVAAQSVSRPFVPEIVKEKKRGRPKRDNTRPWITKTGKSPKPKIPKEDKLLKTFSKGNILTRVNKKLKDKLEEEKMKTIFDF